MMELSEGLKEVAVTHQQWAEDLQDAQLAYEAQAEECAILRQRIVELEAQASTYIFSEIQLDSLLGSRK